MLTENNIKNAKKFCCEDISKIENYDKAIADKSKTRWVCHHKLGIELNKSPEELQEMGIYFNRPASELYFMTLDEHISLHNGGKTRSQETRDKMSKTKKGKLPSNVWVNGHIPWNKGKTGYKVKQHKQHKKHPPRTPEQIENIKVAQRKRREREKQNKEPKCVEQSRKKKIPVPLRKDFTKK